MPTKGTEAEIGTRAALLSAGLHLFGRGGFAATSTRQLAQRAGCNIAAISYHFGGKEGLYLACGDEIARRLTGVLGAPTPEADLRPPSGAPEAIDRIEAMMRAFVRFLCVSSGGSDVAQFILGELAANGPVIDRLYATLIEPKHREICALWAVASGAPADSEEVRLAVFAFLGQIVYFRIGRGIVLRRMGWRDIAEPEAARIADLLARNLRRLLRNGDLP